MARIESRRGGSSLISLVVELVELGYWDWDFLSLDVNVLVCRLEGFQEFVVSGRVALARSLEILGQVGVKRLDHGLARVDDGSLRLYSFAFDAPGLLEQFRLIEPATLPI